ncbi:MAG: hypothetical protein L0H81_05820 [Actinomyces sp.]|nr:hypothetical protein [Actinomyces sp.]MDN6429614.1 hypothetical protein [Propionibacterium sp.]MDN6566008.1 hypothetical protein [Actinomyces sp.]MDN6794873.1 hypothetical protein [Propionibacterium sp.]
MEDSPVDIPGIGTLATLPALDHLDLVAPPVARALQNLAAHDPEVVGRARVASIDPALADTQVLTRTFDMDPALSSNCILVAGSRSGTERVAACLVRATTDVDVNHVVRKVLDVRKASFWPQDRAVEASGMEYGGITPVGIPARWRILLDERVVVGWSCIGSGLRRSKLFVTGDLLTLLPGAQVVEGLAQPGPSA